MCGQRIGLSLSKIIILTSTCIEGMTTMIVKDQWCQ